MAEAVVSSVIGRLNDLVTEEDQVLYGVKDEIQQLVTGLMRMKTFLRDANSRIREDLVSDIRELAYDAEHAVETFLLKVSSSSTINRSRQTINYSTKIKDIEKKMSPILDRFGDYEIRISNSSNRKLKRFYSYTTVEPERFVAFHEDLDCLVGHLVNESDDCYPLISICGMGGLGKTTLAKKIYCHSTVKNYFSGGLAWVSISQKWRTKQVLQRILICLVHGEKEEILTWDKDKLVEKLLEIQQSKKCLIVLDDIWSVDAWDSLKSAFPAEKSRSRLMLTSRHDNVAEHANPNGLIHRPVLLTPEQSWELLKLKALPKGGDCLDITRDPKRMEELGREMVGNCGGLPLAIEMLGGILVTKPSLIEWEKVYYDSLSYPKKGKGFGEKYQSQLLDVLAWSYNDLPSQLKPCFLYLGKYGEDESIHAETLYQLWIAEGMVLSSDKREGETMMQVAESYLGELLQKGMVQVKLNDVESSINFESCFLHDLMRDLAIYQAEAEEFFKVIDLREKNDLMDSRSSSARQLVVHLDDGDKGKNIYHYFGKKVNQQRYRSILLVNEFGTRGLPPALRSHIANFRCLRVLSLEVGIRGFPSGSKFFGIGLRRVLGGLIYLRYLMVSGPYKSLSLFPSIQKLMLLETLRLDRQSGIYFQPWLSRKILSRLRHLRHMYLPLLRIKGLGKNSKLRFNCLSKLETLENFDPKWCEVKDLSKLIGLQKLKLKVRGRDMEEMMENLAVIALSSSSRLGYLELYIVIDEGFKNSEDVLRKLLWNYNFNLQKLTIDGRIPELALLFEQPRQQLLHTHSDVSSIRITRLELFESGLKEDPMPILEKIATLRFLRLRHDLFFGREMICSATGFPKLTRLELSLPSLVKWTVEEGSMPLLSYLQMYDCFQLEELPEGIKFLNSLETLDLWQMPNHLCNKLRKGNGKKGVDFHKVAHIPSLRIRY